MKQNTYFLAFYAADADAGAGGNNAVKAEVNQTTDIMDNFVLPKPQRGAARGTKYIDGDIATKVEKMKPGQGIIVPFMADVTPKRHRYALKYRIDEWAATQAVAEQKEGDKVLKEGKLAPKFSVQIMEGKGIGVRRDS